MRIDNGAPGPTARAAGAFYLITFLAGPVALYAGRRIVVSGDVAATAANIRAHGSLLLVSFADFLLMTASYVVVTALFYELFRPVDRTASRVAAFFSLVGCAVQGAACLFLLAPITLLGEAPYLEVFRMEQRQAMAFLSLRLHTYGFNVGIVFFAFYCLLIGFLILRSTFLPSVLGVGMLLAGLGWLTSLWPPLARSLSPYVLVPGFVGEGSLTLWLLFKGVDVRRWWQQAGAEAVSAA